MISPIDLDAFNAHIRAALKEEPTIIRAPRGAWIEIHEVEVVEEEQREESHAT